MIKNTEILHKLLNEFSLELEQSKKMETAIFFKKLATSIESDNIQEVLDKILASASISQYASFTYKQDQLFDKIFSEAYRIKFEE